MDKDLAIAAYNAMLRFVMIDSGMCEDDLRMNYPGTMEIIDRAREEL